MNNGKRPWTRRWLTAMLMLSLLCLTNCATAHRREMGDCTKRSAAETGLSPISPTLRVIPADRVVRALPNGNYEVTPAWIQDRYRLESWQASEIQRLKGE